jgi:hypothetical protein
MWPAVSLVNYWFVPVHLRVLVINLAAFVWWVPPCSCACRMPVTTECFVAFEAAVHLALSCGNGPRSKTCLGFAVSLFVVSLQLTAHFQPMLSGVQRRQCTAQRALILSLAACAGISRPLRPANLHALHRITGWRNDCGWESGTPPDPGGCLGGCACREQLPALSQNRDVFAS